MFFVILRDDRWWRGSAGAKYRHQNVQTEVGHTAEYEEGEEREEAVRGVPPPLQPGPPLRPGPGPPQARGQRPAVQLPEQARNRSAEM